MLLRLGSLSHSAGPAPELFYKQHDGSGGDDHSGGDGENGEQVVACLIAREFLTIGKRDL